MFEFLHGGFDVASDFELVRFAFEQVISFSAIALSLQTKMPLTLTNASGLEACYAKRVTPRASA